MEINSKRIKFQIRKNHFIRNDRIIIYYKYIIWVLIIININRKKYRNKNLFVFFLKF